MNGTAPRPRSSLALGLAALLICSAALGGEPKVAAWWDKDWKYRKEVRIDFPMQGNDLPVTFFEPTNLLGERPITGKAALTLEIEPTDGGRDIVVIDEAGKVVPSRAYPSGWGGDRLVTVLFRADPKTAHYWIYYGNPASRQTPTTWKRSTYPLMMVTVPVADPADIETPSRAAKAVLAAKQERGKIGTYSVNNPANPFGLEAGQNYITLYSGLLFVPTTGAYDLSVEAGGTAHLLLDGSLVLTVRGSARPAATWTHKAPVKLTKGLHNFTILHGERDSAQGIRIGWAPPGERTISLMTGTAFASGTYAAAEIVGFDQYGKEVTPFFTVEAADVAFKIGGGKALVPVKLNNYTRGDGLSFKWTAGALNLTGRSPLCYLEPESQWPVSLEVFRGGQSLGKYQQPVSLRGIRQIRADVVFELLRCPDVIYEGEGAKLTLKVANLCEYPLPLRYEVAAGKGEPVAKDFEVIAGGEEPLDIAIPLPAAGESSVVASVRLFLVGVKQGEQVIRVVRPDASLADMQPKLGHLFDRDGRRIVVLSRLEDANERRHWAVVKWLARQVEAAPKKILLFGDAMANGSDDGNGGGYVGILRKGIEAGGRTFAFAAVSDDPVVPCTADIPLFAAALAKHAPDLVILAPGTSNASRGVSAQQLARALDVCIDLARSSAGRPRVVLVSPPPLVSNPRLSAELAGAVATVAEQHAAAFVDLHSLVTRQENWKALYKQDTTDEIYYLYPNARAQESFAEAILNAVR